MPFLKIDVYIYICKWLLSDTVDDINLNRYLDMPLNDFGTFNLPLRRSCDIHTNSFGKALLNLCKEKSLYIMNGRLNTR